jgi:hypothetical protein
MTDSETKETKSGRESESKSKEIMTDSKTKETKRTKQNVKVEANKVKAINRPKN